MKKQNKQRQQLLQRKRTKRNASRKGVKYDPYKLFKAAKAPIQDSTPLRDDAVLAL